MGNKQFTHISYRQKKLIENLKTQKFYWKTTKQIEFEVTVKMFHISSHEYFPKTKSSTEALFGFLASEWFEVDGNRTVVMYHNKNKLPKSLSTFMRYNISIGNWHKNIYVVHIIKSKAFLP